MNALFIALAMFVTIVLVLTLGIGLSYLAASSILRIMGHRPQTQPAVLTTAEASSSGD